MEQNDKRRERGAEDDLGAIMQEAGRRSLAASAQWVESVSKAREEEERRRAVEPSDGHTGDSRHTMVTYAFPCSEELQEQIMAEAGRQNIQTDAVVRLAVLSYISGKRVEAHEDLELIPLSAHAMKTEVF